MNQGVVFKQFKAKVNTDGRYGTMSAELFTPLVLLEEAVRLAILSGHSPEEIQNTVDGTESLLRPSLMKSRRCSGDVVCLVGATGWGGSTGTYRISSGNPTACLTCLNPECQEWPNLECLDEHGNGIGEFAYHVSECQMFDR